MRSILKLRQMLGVTRKEMATRLGVQEREWVLRKIENEQVHESEFMVTQVSWNLSVWPECAAQLLFTDKIPTSVLKRFARRLFNSKLEDYK